VTDSLRTVPTVRTALCSGGAGGVKARLAIEQASTFGWGRYVGGSGRVIGMKTFGASAPLKALQQRFGYEPDRVVVAAKELLVKP
jgi:transketolase